MGRYLWQLAGAFIASLFFVIAFNVVVDVNGLYHPRARALVAQRYVNLLLNSRDGLVKSPYERAVKLALLRATSADCYVTGSSHEMQISLKNFEPAQLRCKALINVATSGSSYEDLITDLGILKSRANLKALYIGVGPWMLRRHADKRWAEQIDDYRAALRNLGLRPLSRKAELIEQLRLGRNAINSEYFTRNVESLFESAEAIRPATERGSSDALTLPDGVLLYSAEFLATKPPPIGAVGDGSYQIAEPYVDPVIVSDLEHALTLFTQKDVHIAFVLMPYHPKVMMCANPGVCSCLRAVSAATHSLATHLGSNAEVIGSYDPRMFGLTPSDFYDDMHLTRTAIARVR